MKELVKSIAQHIVDFPDQVSVNEINSENTNVIELMVAKADMGKVIGRQGRTADAIRTILSCGGQRDKRRFILQIIDEGGNADE